jgi:hypothetical protein
MAAVTPLPSLHNETHRKARDYGPQYRRTGRPSLRSLCKDTRLTSCLPAHVTMIRDNHPAPSLIQLFKTPTPPTPHAAYQGLAGLVPSPASPLTHTRPHTHYTQTRGSTEASAVSASRTRREADVEEQFNGCTGPFEAMGGLCNQMPAPPCLPAHVTDTTPTTAPHYHPPACAPHFHTQHTPPSTAAPLSI